MATDEAARVALLHGIYAIVNDGDDTLALARACMDAGVRVIQYRAKDGIEGSRLYALRALTRKHGALLIVNDHWRAARDFDCDGVHLGPDDDGFLDVRPVRASMGSRLIGLSCGTVEEAQAAERFGADYIGVGAVFATNSKADVGEPIGIGGLREIASAASMPVAAIGGITRENLEAVRSSGVAMAAVISAISASTDPRAAARELVQAWDRDGQV